MHSKCCLFIIFQLKRQNTSLHLTQFILIPALPPNNIYVEPISEERASRSLARIDILNKIRTETLAHPKFDERVKLCQTSYDLPSWWICGKHDKDLLRGAAR